MTELPDHFTPEEVARLLQTTREDIEERIAKGLRCDPEGIRRADVEGLLVLEAMKHDAFEVVEADVVVPVPGRVCTSCGETGHVDYLGSEVLEGSLEFVHLVHTELENAFRCNACGARWTQFKML